MIHTTLKIYEDDTNITQYFFPPSVRASIHVESHMNTFQGEETSLEINFIKRNHVIICFLFCFFYSNSNLLSRMFSEQLYFWRGYFFTIFQSDYFDTAVTFLEHIFFQNSCCFLLFQNSHFSQQLFFQNSFLFLERKFYIAPTS